ncbi:MAG: hypothetical protein JNK87_12770 [Bryobacterales bacterium]|nr:hypothetical protein [Bryobacterales bacterium]
MIAPNLLQGISPSDVVTDPFPHVVIHDPIPPADAAALMEEWPSDAVIQAGLPARSNQRFNLPAAKALADNLVTPRWRAFLTEQTGNAFGAHILRIFGESIPTYVPEFSKQLGGRLEQCRFGVRNRDDGRAHLLLDAQLATNSPVRHQATSVRAAHVDLPEKLFIGLYYLRPPGDTESRGGDLVLCRAKANQPPRMFQREVDVKGLQEVRRIRYGRSVLVLFLNGPLSIHAVTRREPTPHTRRFLNLVGQAPRPLFDVAAYQMPRWRYLAGLLRDRFLDKSEFGFGAQRL